MALTPDERRHAWQQALFAATGAAPDAATAGTLRLLRELEDRRATG